MPTPWQSSRPRTATSTSIAGVQTPAIDEVIGWAQSVLRRTYLAGDSVRGADVRQLPIPQNYGVSTLSDLIAWESDGVSSEVSRGSGAPILA